MTIPKVRKRNLWLSSLIFVAALSICASINISNSFANTNIKDLDIALQYKMSEEMAKENPAFHFKKQGQIYEAERYANGLKGTVTPDGVTFTMGTAEWSLALEKVMSSDKTLQFNRAEAMQAVSMNKNRLELKNQKITEWFVNGLQGFQQGWTIPKPLSDTQDILTLSFASKGNVTADVMEDKRGINLQDSKGSTVFSYAGLYAFDADGKELPVWFEQKDKSIQIQVNDAGAVYPIVIDPHTRLTDSVAGAAGDQLGAVVAISADGNTVAAGAPFVNVWDQTGAGAIYVFVKDGATWTQKAKIYPAFILTDDYLPKSLAINANGTVIVAGLAYTDENPKTEVGRIAVFEKVDDGFSDWANEYDDLTMDFFLPATTANDFMGWSVATDAAGTTIVVGIPGKNSEQGVVYVYTPAGGGSSIWYNNTQTVETAILTASDGVAYDAGAGEGGDALGSSVAISPDGLIIAANAPYADVGGTSNAGAVYLFYKGAGWTNGIQSAKLMHSPAAENDYLGNQFHGSIGISSKDPFVADPATIAVACTAKKAVYVFTYDSDLDLWNPPSKLTASDNATLENCAITPDGSTILSGARDTKKVYGFKKAGNGNTVWDNGSVDQTMSYSQPLGMDDGSFGYSVGITSDGATVVTGATGATAGVGGTQANAGAVHIFPYTEVVSYTVTYNGNGSDDGTVPTDATAYANGADVTVLGNTGTLTKTGATFAGWNTLANGTGTSYAPAATFAISANTTLYAKWTCTVTYDGNGKTGGSVPTDASSPYLVGATVTVLGNTGSLVKTGSTFDGWNTLDDGTGTDYAAAATFAISEDTTLYAKWLGNWITDGSPVTWTQGDGSQATPYLIENAQHLTYLAQQVNAGTTYNGKYFKLHADIDLTDHYWIPIANVDPRSFQGYFDGNNKTVSNVKIGTALSPITDVGYYGLFGRTGWANAEIKNLTVSDVAIYVNAWASIGGLIGDNQGIIDNCSVSGTVGIGTTVFQLNAGGLAGVNGNKIRNSFSTVNIVRSGAANNGRAGGLVGKNYKASTTAGEIENCFATGNVEAGNAAGGLVGWNWADNVSLTPTVINSYATGNVLANTYVGGSVGWHFTQNGASILVDTTYWNSDAVQTLNGGAQNPKKGIGDGTGTTTGLTAAQMSSATGQPNALVDTLNTNKGITNPTWYSWVQAIGTNNGYPTQSLIAPTTQSTNITFSTVQSTQMQIGWTNGNGGNRAVFVKQANAGTATPVVNTTYTANTAFSSGTQIGATGWYCVYNGTGTSVTVTGLTAGTDYIAQVFEYNGSAGSEKYLASDAANNPKTQTTILILAPSVTTQRLPEWTETTPTGSAENKDWSCTAISSDGTYMLAGGWPGRVYLSTNSGVGWTEKLIAGNIDSIWYTVSMSSNGTTMLAGLDGGYLYLSTDNGANWNQAETPVKNQNKMWYTSAISSDGTTMLAGVMNGRLYVSTNSGTAWTEIQPAGNTDQLWDNVAISADGTRMLAGIQNGLLYVSTNSGTSWDETTPTGSSVNAETWRCIAISGDGSKMLAGLNNGRIYISTNNGTSWSQTAPTGVLEDKAWKRASISSDGQKMIVVLDGGTVYISTNGGTSWAETRPTGAAGANWMDVDISYDGTKSLIPVNVGRVYLGTIPTTLFVPTNIAPTSATVPGTITNLNGGPNATTRGVIYYTTDADKVLADVDNVNVKKVSEGNGSGDYGIGDFTMGLAGLSPNIQYFYRSYATNDNGDGYGSRTSFWTAANTPSASTVNNPTVTTLDVTINVNANPASTTFAIQETSTGNYVWSDGTLGGTSPDWNTAADWGAVSGTSGKITVTGLTPGATYTFQVKAKNGGGTATAFGGTASGVPAAAPSIVTTGAAWVAPIAENRDWISTAISSNGSKMLGAVYGGRIYLSTDSGETWNETQPVDNDNYNWQSVAMSSDGNTMAAAVNGGSVYVSIDGGANWSDSGLSSSSWYSVSISSDGSVMLASAEEGRVYLSIDSGANWNETQPIDDNDYSWYSTAISSDGSKMLTGAYGTKLYLSTDTGTSWNQMSPPTATRDWYVAMSPDGMTMLAGEYRGRLYLSTNGGTSWSETRPTGIDETKKWIPLSISSDGTKMLAGVYSTSPNRLYLSTDKGVTWSETRPTGIDEDNYWQAVSISSDGSKMLAAVNGGKVYCGAFSSVTNIAATSATAPGNITASNGAAITARGMIYYPYTGGDKVIGGVDVTQVAGSGPFVTGAFTIGLTGLSGNTRYNVRAYATNSVGTTYGNTADFWTLAIVPAAPTVDNATATTLDVTVNVNSNPASTEFAIQETSTGNYVQADGTLNTDAVWQTAAAWGTKTVTGLTTGTTYTFKVKARNSGSTETAFGETATGVPAATPTVTTQAVSDIASTTATGNGNIIATNGANATNRGVIYYTYTDTDKIIGDGGVTDVSANGDYGTGAFTASLTALSPNTQYNARAHATTPNGTGYGARVDFWTLANVPSAPTVNTPTAITLNVTVNVNDNPASTEFCINETSTNTHVQANGELAAGEVWQNAATWGTKTVTGLTTGNTHIFKVKARNGGSTETAYGATASGVPAELPTVTTQAVSSIGETSATGNGNITALGTPTATQYGVCWNTTTTPTTANSKTEQGAAAATGVFTSSITGLSASTTYYVRAYATNSAGTAYGDQVSFTTLSPPPPPPPPPVIIDPPVVTPPTITTDTQTVTSGTVTNSGEHEDVTVGTGTTVTNSGTLTDLDNSGTINGGVVAGDSVNSGIMNDITTEDDSVITNSGTLTDLNNNGTINGGVVAGDSVNDGVMNDVTLPENTALDNAGGTLADADNAGEVFGGTIEGTVTNTGVIAGTTPDGVIDASYAVTISESATVSGGEVAGAVINNGVLDSVTIGSNAVISFGNSGQITGSITVIDEEGVACVIAIPPNIVYPDPQSLTQGFVLTPQAIRAYAKANNWDVKIQERRARLQRNSSTLPQVPSYYYLIDGVVFSETGSKSTQEIDMVVPFNPDNIPDVITTSDIIVLVYDYESKTWKTVAHTLSGNNVKIKTDLVSAVAIVAEGIFTVTYDGNGSTGGTVPGSQVKANDLNLTLSKNTGNLVKTGYKFAGWNTSADGSETNYAEEALYSTNISVTLYAKWIVEESVDPLVAAVKDADKTIKDAQTPNPDSPSSPPEEEDVVEAIDKVVYALDMATGMIKNGSVTPSGALIVLPVAGDVLKLMGESSGNGTGVNKEKVVYILQKSSTIMSQALEGELTSETQNSIVNGADGILGAMPSIIASMDKEDGFAVVAEIANIVSSGIQAGLSATGIDSARLTGFVDNISDVFTALPLDTTITGNTNIVKNAADIIVKALNALTHGNADNTNKNSGLVIGQLQKEVASIIDAIHANMLKNPVPFSDLTQAESVKRQGSTESDLLSPEKVENLTQEIASILKPFIYKGSPLDKVLMESTISVANGAFSAIFHKLGSNRGVEINSSELTSSDVLKPLFVDNPLLIEDILDITGVDVSKKSNVIDFWGGILKAEISLKGKNTSAILSALPQLFNLESVVVEEKGLKATDVVTKSLEHIFKDSNISYISPFPGIMEITIKWNETMEATYPVMVSGVNAVAATLPEGIYFLSDTRLVMISDNLAVTLLPVFGNLLTLVNQLIQSGAGFKIFDDGRWSADLGSGSPMIFGMTGYGKAILSENDVNKPSDAGNTAAVDFLITGDNPSSRDYCLEVVYNGKESQVMPPALHTSALNHIINLLEPLNLKYNINRNNGVITIGNSWFLKPDYLVYPLSEDALEYWKKNKDSYGVTWKQDDYNLDGFADIEIFTSEGRQVIYEVKP